MNKDSDSPSQKASSDFDSGEPRILEGEVVGKIPQKKSPPKNSPPLEFNLSEIPFFRKLKRNCLLAVVSFFALTIAAIYFHNGWLFLLALLLPPWIFSQKKF